MFAGIVEQHEIRVLSFRVEIFINEVMFYGFIEALLALLSHFLTILLVSKQQVALYHVLFQFDSKNQKDEIHSLSTHDFPDPARHTEETTNLCSNHRNGHKKPGNSFSEFFLMILSSVNSEILEFFAILHL